MGRGRRPTPPPDIRVVDQLVDLVAAEFGMDRRHLLGRREDQKVVRARHAAVVLLSACGLTNAQMGHVLGRDPSGMSYALKTAKRRGRTDPAYRARVAELLDRARGICGGGRSNRRDQQPLQARLSLLRAPLAAAAQRAVDEHDWESGGACDAVQSALWGVLAEHGIDATEGGHDGDDHAWLVVYDARTREVCGLDVPASVYEEGGGYSWTRIDGAEVEPSDVVVWPVDVDPSWWADLEGHLGSLNRRIRGRLRERGPAPISLHRKRRDLTVPAAVLAPYAHLHPLLYHLSGEETPGQPRGLVGPEVEALYLVASWLRKVEAGRMSGRAFTRRLERAERRLEQLVDEREPSPDFEQLERDVDDADREAGEEEAVWRGGDAKLARLESDEDRWRRLDGTREREHYEARGRVVDPELKRRGVGGYTDRAGWVEIDGRPVTYAQRLSGSAPYPDHTWVNPITRQTYRGREHPYPPVLYADTGEVVPLYERLPPPRYARDAPVRWRRRTRPLKDTLPALPGFRY